MPLRKLTMDLKDTGPNVHVIMKGVLDEDADLKPLLQFNNRRIQFDLEGIDLINSAGVRVWVNTFSKFPKDALMTFQKCSSRVIEQLNYVSNFIAHGQVESFFAPYFCPKCKTEQIVLLETKSLKKAAAPDQKCRQCKGALEFDDVEEEYFSFIEN